MNLFWSHTGPYFGAPCQRNRFPSLVDELGENGDKLVAHLGISNIADMGARLKRGHKASKLEEQRAAECVKNACVPLQRMFCSSAQDLRRGVDKYVQIPLNYLRIFQPTNDPWKLTKRYRKLVIICRTLTGSRQEGEPPYTGSCPHCRRDGSDDVYSDEEGRECLHGAFIMGEINMVIKVHEEREDGLYRNHE